MELKDPEIYLEAIDFYDGTSLLYKEHDHPLYTDSISVVDGRKKINDVHLVLEYQHIKEAKKISLDRKNRTSIDKKIQLSQIESTEAKLIIDPLLEDKIFYIEALDATGKALYQQSVVRTNLNEDYLKSVDRYIDMLLQKIADNIIIDKESMIDFMYKHQPPVSSFTYSYTFAGTISSLNIYLDPVIEKQQERFSLKNSVSYDDGVTAIPENNKYGLMDKAGNWVIKPTYGYLQPYGLGFYYVYNTRWTGEEKGKLARFDGKNKTLNFVPYHIMSTEKLINNRYLQITSNPKHNMEKGLLDIKTSKVILSPSERYIDANRYFYVSDHKKNNLRFYEIYRFADHKKILEGYFNKVTLNENIISVESLIDFDQEPETYDYFKNGKYFKTQGTFYNEEGELLSEDILKIIKPST